MHKTENPGILLIHMPFGINYVPSLSLSLLKEAVKKKGYSSVIKYYSVKFTELIGEINYLLISMGLPVYHYLFGEWLFAASLFDNLLPDQQYISEILSRNQDKGSRYNPGQEKYIRDFIDLIPVIKSKTGPFLESCLEEITALKPKIVGFTSSFQQNVASLSLAKRIKEKLPETVVVFGGANCEGRMGVEIIRKFPFVDIIVSGEADETFPELVSVIMEAEPGSKEYCNLKGVICRENLDSHAECVISSPMVTEMDSIPFPDFEDYFRDLETYGARSINSIGVPQIERTESKVYSPVVVFETSRGCWWGEKSHCTFCGLNGNNMAHRSKSADRALAEMKYLKYKYKVNGLIVTDNILDMSYFKDFVPALARENLDLRLFYEVKANLTKQQLTLLKAADIADLQPGVESLNTHVLDLMKKGVKAIQNVQLLKWCKELGLTPVWTLLWGFPGETRQDYREMAGLIPKISHLAPPNSISRIRLDRFSPNFNFPEKFGIKKFAPNPAYKYIFPFEEESLHNLAYFFEYEYEPDHNFDSALESVKNEIYRWIDNCQEVDLFFIDRQEALVVYDLRGLRKEHFFILPGKERFIYLFCDGIKPFSKIKAEFQQQFNYENDPEIQSILDSLIEKNLMIRENNSYLSLALPLGTYSPGKKIIGKLAALLKVKQPGVKV
jgi:ribosomal peptide maturation radical SAM protein 1